jgi:Zn-dependent peptidase ImmA (M78 family)
VIYGPRLRHARLILGETQTQFADKVGLLQSQVSRIEKTALAVVPESVLLHISDHTGFPPEFFERPLASRIQEIQFRARLTSKAVDRNQAVACADLVHESYALMRLRLAEPIPVRFPRMVGSEPRKAAREFRRFLQLPSGPIANLTLPAERHGLVILALPVEGRKHDAFSWWQREEAENYPVLAILAGAAGDRLRWNLAHEIGHLVLHSAEAGRDVERQADEFAAELLTPRDAMRGEIPSNPKLSALYAMKLRWGVSVQSLIRRAREVERVTEENYMGLFRQVSARGERMNERFHIDREKPRVYRKMAEVLFGDSPASGLAQLCAWTEDFARDVLDQHASQSELPSRRVLVNHAPGRTSGQVIPLRRRSPGSI